MIGFLFAAVAVLCGIAVNRAMRVPLSLAPLTGLAAMAILTTWMTAAGLPPLARTASVAVPAFVGLALAVKDMRPTRAAANTCRLPLLVLAAATAAPAVMLGATFAGVGAPVSTHDGAFHVETIERLRAGAALGGWYPTGFHASVAAVLGLAPWVDSARGTLEAGQGLAILTPVAVFALGLALGFDALIAAIAALIIGVTWTYPYDYHLWAGWPQGMGVLLLIGLCATALQWIARPNARMGILLGVFAGAIVLTHGTEVYSAVLVFAVVAAARYRRLVSERGALLRHAPLALGVAVLCMAPYLSALLGWAGGGGATAAGAATIEGLDPTERSDWLQFALGITGAGSLVDLPVRVALIVLGLFVFRARFAGGLWAVFVALLLVMDTVDLPIVRTLFAVTYPWLDHDRPRQVAVVFASFLSAGGVWVLVTGVRRLRARWILRPNLWRRFAIACGLLTFFFAEGSAVSIYKRLNSAVAEQNVYSADDAAAMAWLRAHVGPNEVVANDLSGDAGIWAPYKAQVPILLPRSASGPALQSRELILENMLDLSASPRAQGQACALHVDYLFHGAAPRAYDERLFADREALERAPDLHEVFSSGEATVFRIQLPCN